MGTGIVATLHALICISVAYFFRIKSNFEDAVIRAFILWIVLLGPIFFLRDPLFFFAATTFCIFVATPKEYSNKVAFFILIFPAAPLFISYQVSLPGINNLIILNYLKLAILVVLVPSLLKDLNSNKNKMQLNTLDIIMIIFVIYMILMSFRGANVTSVFRIAVDKTLFYLVPYFVISRSLYDFKKIEKIVLAFFILALILCFIGILSSLKRWEFYRAFEPATVFSIPIYRFGLLRVGGIVSEGALGLCVGIGLISLQYIRYRYGLSLFRLWLFRSIFAFGLICSGIRGAILATMIMFLSYLFLYIKAPAIRALMILTGIVGIIGYSLFAPEITLDEIDIDEIGTFSYRYELLVATVNHVIDHPLFGSASFTQSPHFQHLLQGQGIIDFVNYFVQIVVEFGLVGLFIFIFIHVMAAIYLYRFYSKMNHKKNIQQRRLVCVMLAVLTGYILFIGTISNVSIIGLVGVIIIAISRGFDTKNMTNINRTL